MVIKFFVMIVRVIKLKVVFRVMDFVLVRGEFVEFDILVFYIERNES